MEDPLIAVRMKYVEDITDILECPVCFELPPNEVYSCHNGHHICKNCKNSPRVNICPTCNSQYYGSRNYLAENLAVKFEEIKLSILDPNHAINRKILENRKCVDTQTYIETDSNSTQTEVVDYNCKGVQTEYTGTTIETQTDFRTLDACTIETQTIKEEFTKNEEIETLDSQVLRSCQMKNCTYSCSINDLICHVKSKHKEAFLEVAKSVDGIFTKCWNLSYKTDTSFDCFLHILDIGGFFFRISIDKNGNLLGMINSLSEDVNKQSQYMLLISNKQNPLISDTFVGRVPLHLLLDLKNIEHDIFISNSKMEYTAKENQSFVCYLTLFSPKYSCEF